ncbi:hypothetical protein BaRGS_00026537 [Batillaria attramentaria]|uniref:Mammalian ependymin-related protein 1-like n=1 Tax=Batillaria attramentaria TaxID=370345 RepID=A0ABD0K5Q7_9CAEN
MWAAILLLAATLAYAQQPKPCTSPAQWEGRFYRTDYSKNFTQYARISYDETNKRVRETEEIETSTERDYYDVLRLFNENKEYRLNLRDRKCNVTALTRKWYPFGIPDEGNSPDCVPVTFGFRSNQTGFVHTTFYDVTNGIVNPTVFNPPSECQG